MLLLPRNTSEALVIGRNRHGEQVPVSADPGEVAHCGKWSKPSQANSRILRVLIADNDRDTADTLAMLVRLWGHDVRHVYNGAAALEMASVYHPDVCMLDIAMPGLDGSQVARRLRERTDLGNLLLLAITGWADEAHRLHCMKAGFHHYLVKPADLSIVENLLLAHQARLRDPPALRPVLHRGNTMPIVKMAVSCELQRVVASSGIP